jgi:uncharacterized protein (DUF58 family)
MFKIVMVEKRRLNVDVWKTTAEFYASMRDLELKLKLYQRMLRGKGFEFDGFREYSQDDDSSIIDWKASSRAGKTVVKQYAQEKNLKVMFVVDVGEGMTFGSSNKLKCEYSAEMCVALSDLVLKTGNYAGYLLFNNNVVKYVQPSKENKKFQMLIDDLTDIETYKNSFDFSKVLDFIVSTFQSVDSIIFISDFVSLNETHKNLMAYLSQKYETLALIVRDPVEEFMPDINKEFIIEDPTSNRQILINPKVVRVEYNKNVKERDLRINSLFRMTGFDFINLKTDVSFVPVLSSFFRNRTKSLTG